MNDIIRRKSAQFGRRVLSTGGLFIIVSYWQRIVSRGR